MEDRAQSDFSLGYDLAPSVDPSIAQYKFHLLEQERLESEKVHVEKVENIKMIGQTGWEAWSGGQQAQAAELLAGDEFEINPDYMNKNFISRAFTPGKDRVQKIASGTKDVSSGIKPDPKSLNLTSKVKDITTKTSDFSSVSPLQAAGVAYEGLDIIKSLQKGDAGSTMLKTAKMLKYTPNPVGQAIGWGATLFDLIF